MSPVARANITNAAIVAHTMTATILNFLALTVAVVFKLNMILNFKVYK
jgi:hypothetical protein